MTTLTDALALARNMMKLREQYPNARQPTDIAEPFAQALIDLADKLESEVLANAISDAYGKSYSRDGTWRDVVTEVRAHLGLTAGREG